jgi:dihydrodipicolinate synthase/N-acetylneuraminate lyase
MLAGIVPIVLIPFTADATTIDEDGLRRIVRFELEGGADGIGVNGFASETYKLTDDERRRTVEIVAGEIGDGVPLIIGIAPGSTEAAIQQAQEFARYKPAALMTLPPNTMRVKSQALVEHYVTLAQAVDVPIMVQQSPHIQAYSATGLEAEALAEIAERASNVRYFKIEGPGSAERIAALRPLISTDRVGLFGGGGGITLLDELRAGAGGLIPGVGFNEYFVRAWEAWKAGNVEGAEQLIHEVQPLVSAVSGRGHEFSLHARKYLLKRAGIIRHTAVRQPTIGATEEELYAIGQIADTLTLRLSGTPGG